MYLFINKVLVISYQNIWADFHEMVEGTFGMVLLNDVQEIRLRSTRAAEIEVQLWLASSWE